MKTAAAAAAAVGEENDCVLEMTAAKRPYIVASIFTGVSCPLVYVYLIVCII